MNVEELSDWIVSSNESLNIFLTRPGQRSSSFNPAFTYPVFGEDESILGYQDLAINLRLRDYDLKPSVDMTWSAKMDPLGEVKPMDLEDMLREFLPQHVFAKALQNGSEPEKSFKPPGRVCHSYSSGGERYEVWQSNLADPLARAILENGRILIPLYIEAGTVNFLDDPEWSMERWKVFFLYKPLAPSTNNPYSLIGFCTSYRLWVFPTVQIRRAMGETIDPATEDDYAVKDLESYASDPDHQPPFNPITQNASRERISQFLILPPYQGQSHGARLYTAVTASFLRDKTVYESTVEDPNEAFDDMRDWCDLARLRADPVFTALTLPATLPAEHFKPTAAIPSALLLPQPELTRLREAYKIPPRQFARLLEMHLLALIPPRHRSPRRLSKKHRAPDPNDRRYYFWRLLVKERIYLRNRDQLVQLELEERREKVEQSCLAVEEEYGRLLEGAERRAALATLDAEDEAANGADAGAGAARGKRKKRVVEDDEEDEDEDEVAITSTAAKRLKIDEAVD